MDDIMIDIETLGTKPNSVILTIGAIRFNRKQKIVPFEKLKNYFYRKIDISSCVKIGLEKDNDTLKWWESQHEDIRKEAFEGKREDLKKVLLDFSNWVSKDSFIWSHGASFDTVILENAFKKCGLQTPWKFFNVRDTRTVYDIFGIKKEDMPSEQNHNALYDCWRQIIGINKALI
jgi:DNA polymerase III epsilon subunit-like protein